MNLQHPPFKHRLPDSPHVPVAAYANHTRGTLTMSLLVSLCLAGWLVGPVQAAIFGPIASGDETALIDAIMAANDEIANPGADTI